VGEHLFTGYQILEPRLFDVIPDQVPCDIVRDVYRSLCRTGEVGAYFHEGFWWEFGSPELYLEGSLKLLDYSPERLREISAEHDPLRRLDQAAAAVGPGAEIDKGARFRGRVALGYASHVSEDALVEDSVVMPEAWIGPASRLRRSIVGQDVELPAGFVGDGVVICADPGRQAPPIPRVERTNGLLVLRL
jgi:NDP-sugar pyrophosphorylase family protein